MLQTKLDYLVLLPNFLAYFGTAAVLTVAFLVLYTAMTPVKEWSEIKAGNSAAALSLSGALLGFALALGSVISNSQSLLDMAAWGLVALVVQLVVFGVVRLGKPDLVRRIGEGSLAHGILLATASVSAGILNAASMTY
jgi:putative membrane protein